MLMPGTRALTSIPGGPPARPLPVLVPLIRQEHSIGTDHYRETGWLLLEAKRVLKHGGFQRWVEQTFRDDFSYRSALDYMRLAAKKHQGAFLRQARQDPATRRNARRTAPAARGVKDEDKGAICEMARDLIDAGHRALTVKLHPDKPGGR